MLTCFLSSLYRKHFFTTINEGKPWCENTAALPRMRRSGKTLMKGSTAVGGGGSNSNAADDDVAFDAATAVTAVLLAIQL